MSLASQSRQPRSARLTSLYPIIILITMKIQSKRSLTPGV